MHIFIQYGCTNVFQCTGYYHCTTQFALLIAAVEGCECGVIVVGGSGKNHLHLVRNYAKRFRRTRNRGPSFSDLLPRPSPRAIVFDAAQGTCRLRNGHRERALWNSAAAARPVVVVVWARVRNSSNNST